MGEGVYAQFLATTKAMRDDVGPEMTRYLVACAKSGQTGLYKCVAENERGNEDQALQVLGELMVLYMIRSQASLDETIQTFVTRLRPILFVKVQAAKDKIRFQQPPPQGEEGGAQ